jgi:hypothetical protein
MMKIKIVLAGDSIRRVWEREILIAEKIRVEELYHLEYNAVKPVESQLFKEIFRLHPQQYSCLVTASCWFLLGLHFNPEDGGNTFLRNSIVLLRT